MQSAPEQKLELMGVENLGFLLDNLGKDCGPYQVYRELTQNSVDALAPVGGGKIIWDVQVRPGAKGKKTFKLCVIDTGTGMSREDLQQFINRLSSSGRTQSFTANFGIGAKIAAATRNPYGLVYLTWKDGQGHMAWMMRDPATGEYGLRRFQDDAGHTSEIVALSDDDKPQIRGEDGMFSPIGDHGTCVILMGDAEHADTIDAPDKQHGTGSGWLEHYLNTRYFRFPDGIDVQARFAARSTNKQINGLRDVRGQKWYLDTHARDFGTVELEEADLHWWVITDEDAAKEYESRYATAHHMAVIFQDELYEVVRSNQALARMHSFGVVFGAKHVVMYVEPRVADGRLAANAQRTHLQLDHADLPWDLYADQFRERMPDKLREHQSRHIASDSGSGDRTRVLKERIGKVRTLLRAPRYRAVAPNLLAVPKPRPARPADGAAGSGRSARPSSPREIEVEVVTLEEVPAGPTSTLPAAEQEPQTLYDEMTEAAVAQEAPTCVWVRASDQSRDPGEMEDRAARYIPETNILKINEDFRVFHEYANRWIRRYRGKSIDELLLRSACVEAVKEWYELALVQTVMAAGSLSVDPTWSDEQAERLLSEEALTAAVLQPFHIDAAVKKALGQRLGSLKG